MLLLQTVVVVKQGPKSGCPADNLKIENRCCYRKFMANIARIRVPSVLRHLFVFVQSF